MAKTVHLDVAPPLPAGPVDFNALHEACMAGKSATDALLAAGVAPEAEAPTAPAEESAPAPSEDF